MTQLLKLEFWELLLHANHELLKTSGNSSKPNKSFQLNKMFKILRYFEFGISVKHLEQSEKMNPTYISKPNEKRIFKWL